MSDEPIRQLVPRVSSADVDRILGRDFEPEARARVRALLDAEPPPSPRVALAVLKLSAGDVAAVEANLEVARRDWRDTVASAEYPAYMALTAAHPPRKDWTREVARAVDAAIRADWEQYQRWLESSHQRGRPPV